MHPASLPTDALMKQCAVERTKRSGPGGQNRNKVETAVVLHHTRTGVTGQASERRSQAENLREALFRLRINLALEVREPRRPTDPPSALWRSRAVGGRIACNPRHDDFPSLLAEALDTLAIHADDPAAASQSLGVSPTQFVKFIGREPRALASLNARRAAAGLHALR
ncbi:MAG: peptide chain release factor-like protein [Planctomycetes bacterium]|nr:peptide chain release factor-like protein [Planctomycetota bacterium]